MLLIDLLSHPCLLFQQPISARCMRVFLKLGWGVTLTPGTLPPVTACPMSRVARAQRYCLHSDQHVLGDECHLDLKYPAVHSGPISCFVWCRHSDHATNHVAVGHCQCCTFCYGLQNNRIVFITWMLSAHPISPGQLEMMCNFLPSF